MNTPITDRREIEKLIGEHGRWWHEIELAPGIVTPGDDSNRMKLPILDELGLPREMNGLRALDIGCSDGYFAFEMEKRGASVVAIDFVPATSSGFATAARILGSDVEYRIDSVYNLSIERYGKFDIILCLGVLYHLRNPMMALDAIRSVIADDGTLFVGTMMIDEYLRLSDGTATTLSDVDARLTDIPLWQAWPRDSLNGDWTNCFTPNRAALAAGLIDAEFSVEEIKIVSVGGYARAIPVRDRLVAKYRDLDMRLFRTPFDPDVPYFLDEEGASHEITENRTKPLRLRDRWKIWRNRL